MYEIYKELLDKSGLKTSDVSKATGISAQVFTNWKRRGGSISYKFLQKIADFFEVDVSVFSQQHTCGTGKSIDLINHPFEASSGHIYKDYPSDEAMNVAIQFDELTEEQKRHMIEMLAFFKSKKQD